jgi:hypothetical protein
MPCLVSVPEPASGHQVIRLGGELDLADAPEVREALATGSGRVEVDCGHLTFIDAATLGEIATAAGRRPVMIRHPSAFLVHLLGITGIDQAVQVGDVLAGPDAYGADVAPGDAEAATGA